MPFDPCTKIFLPFRAGVYIPVLHPPSIILQPVLLIPHTHQQA